MKDLVIATLTPSPSMYTYVGYIEGETPTEALDRANNAKGDSLKTCKEHMKVYDPIYWGNRVAELEQTTYMIMSYDEFEDAKKKYYINRPLTICDAETFNEMLNVLPPLKWCTIRGVEMFCMSEMYTGTITNQYARVGDRYYSAFVDVFDQSTWIHERMEG